MAAGDLIPDAAAEEEENEDESNKSTVTPPRRNSHVNIISRSPPTSNTTWSLVSIKDKHNHDDEDSSFLIFPPTNHENLHLSPPSSPLVVDLKRHGKSFKLPSLSPSSSSLSEIVDGDESNDDSSTSTLFSPSTGPDSPPITRARETVGVVKWVSLGMEVLYSKVNGVLSSRWHSIPVHASAFTTVAVVVGFLYFWWRRRRGRFEQRDRDHLVRIIREKDEVCSSTPTSVC